MAEDQNDILQRFMLTDVENITVTNEELGRGAYGRVFKLKYYGKVCAAKEIHSILLKDVGRDELQQIKAMYVRECRQCCVLRHPNIVQFLGLYYPRHHKTNVEGIRAAPRLNELPVIVMELMWGSLKSYVDQSERNIHFASKLSILQDVAHGLMYLHGQKPAVVHRDLSPNNVLLTDHLVAKLSDLGVAKAIAVDSKTSLTIAPGTAVFMPPEAVTDGANYGPQLDMFSYGGVTLYLASQQWPKLLPLKRFDFQRNETVFLTEIDRRQQYIDGLTGDNLQLKRLVTDCLNENPFARPTAVDIVTKVSVLVSCHTSMPTQLLPKSLGVNQESYPPTYVVECTIRITCRSPGCSFEVSQSSEEYCSEGYCSDCYRKVESAPAIYLSSTSVSVLLVV